MHLEINYGVDPDWEMIWMVQGHPNFSPNIDVMWITMIGMAIHINDFKQYDLIPCIIFDLIPCAEQFPTGAAVLRTMSIETSWDWKVFFLQTLFNNKKIIIDDKEQILMRAGTSSLQADNFYKCQANLKEEKNEQKVCELKAHLCRHSQRQA